MNKLATLKPSIRLYLWPYRLLLLGPGFDASLHRHQAAQLCFGLDGPLCLRTAAARSWQEHAGFFVPPSCPHEFAAKLTRTAILYVEAESSELAAFKSAASVGTAIARLSCEIEVVARLRELAAKGGAIERANEICRAVLGLKDAPERHAALDPRIADSLRIIRAHFDQRLRLSAVASAVNMSESWLAHRFRSEVGVPMRRYILWRRLRRAVEAALEGMSLTRAAHAAGLSDSSHLSRTFRETFGVTPSFLFDRRDHLDVHLYSEHPS